MTNTPQSTMETVKVQGAQLLDEVKRLVHEGNVRRIVIKQDDRTIVEFPLTVGVVGAVFAPVLAAAGAIAALLTDCTIEVERMTEPPQPPIIEGKTTDVTALRTVGTGGQS
jgi:hypothetical protein